MIILGKDKVDERYNIDDNGIITDLNGNVQELKLYQGRPDFRGVAVHKIQMWTKFGWRDGKVWDIHHIDGNKLNNNLNNLKFLLHGSHTSLHSKGKQISNETRNKISKSEKGRTPWNKGKKNVYSEETIRKMSINYKGVKGLHWKLDPITNKRIYY